MAAVVLPGKPFEPKPQQNTPLAFALALAMHALLVAALWVSVQWRVEPQGEVIAELWAEVVPEPPPPVLVEPVAPQLPAQPDVDIAVKQTPKPPEAKRVEPRKDEAAERRRAEQREETQREAVRKAEEARLIAQAGSPDVPAQATAAIGGGDASYAALLVGIIKPRIVFAVPDRTSPAVYADFQVDLLPTGEILSVRLLKPSSLPGYDAAVERAIRRTDPFPRKRDGSVDRTVIIRFRPVDTQ